MFSTVAVKPCRTAGTGITHSKVTSVRCSRSVALHMALPRPTRAASARTQAWLQSAGRAKNILRAVARSRATTNGRARLVCNALDFQDYVDAKRVLVFLRPEFTALIGVFFVYVYVDKFFNKGNRKASQLDWPIQEKFLREKEVRSITPFEAKSLVTNKGYVLLDVRKNDDYEKRHLRGSLNVPLYVTATSVNPKSLLKAALLFSQGLTGTEENTKFVAEVAALVEKGQGIIVLDESSLGGLNRTLNRPTGTQSRALKAAYLLLSESDMEMDQPLLHLDGGINALYKEGYPQEPRPGLDGDNVDTSSSSKIW